MHGIRGTKETMMREPMARRATRMGKSGLENGLHTKTVYLLLPYISLNLSLAKYSVYPGFSPYHTCVPDSVSPQAVCLLSGLTLFLRKIWSIRVGCGKLLVNSRKYKDIRVNYDAPAEYDLPDRAAL